MELDGCRALVVGATGVIGGALAQALLGRGAAVALAGRDRTALDAVASRCGDAPAATFDAYDLAAVARLPGWAADRLGGLDLVVCAIGTVAFGEACRTTDAVAEHLVTVNALAPAALARGALPLLEAGGTFAAITGVVAEHPQPLMADYSASKAALAAWLRAVRREQRGRRVRVLDICLPHLDTGFADRAVHGTPPSLPPGADFDQAVARIVAALANGAESVRPGADGTLVAEGHAR
ncbi:SDR family NAD(P)-dependent oxidoreductase [Streptomyces sp. NBC_01198]|uniref:SDR family NAD(P)-dependent oxidoreductase n=1 Tax=Streptomyces sp. NBC_01198 TaxID=2903769 RepID=UPI002E13F5D6|nr:SDR family oxidoreductase [Streptomyces sp. NBC_01198]